MLKKWKVHTKKQKIYTFCFLDIDPSYRAHPPQTCTPSLHRHFDTSAEIYQYYFALPTTQNSTSGLATLDSFQANSGNTNIHALDLHLLGCLDVLQF